MYVDMVVSQPKLSLGWLMSVVWNCLEKKSKEEEWKEGSYRKSHFTHIILLKMQSTNRYTPSAELMVRTHNGSWGCNVFVRRPLEAPSVELPTIVKKIKIINLVLKNSSYEHREGEENLCVDGLCDVCKIWANVLHKF